MRCGCTRCLLEAALALLRTDRPRMAAMLIEQALRQAERERVERSKPVKPPVRRKARARA
jgi:hypothetical protein